jgi:hypothetical protein
VIHFLKRFASGRFDLRMREYKPDSLIINIDAPIGAFFTPSPLKGEGLLPSMIERATSRAWAIDTAIPMREVDAQGTGKDRKDCMQRFRTAWDKFSADPARLTEFLQVKRKRL